MTFGQFLMYHAAGAGIALGIALVAAIAFSLWEKYHD